MKNLITAIACVLILCIFIMQLVTNQVTQTKMMTIEEAINAFTETAKQDGCLTPSNIAQLKRTIAKQAGCDEEFVIVTGTTSPVKRGEFINYNVQYPIKNAIGGANVLGVSEAESTINKTVKGVTVSEYIAR